MLVFVMPHQFLARTCPKIVDCGLAKECRALSLIKGIEFEDGSPVLISNMIKEQMNGMDVSVLMGANVANEVARDEFCESTVGYGNAEHGKAWQMLLHYPTFQIGTINDVAGTELCGALKNVVALGAGFCDGIGLGGNTKVTSTPSQPASLLLPLTLPPTPPGADAHAAAANVSRAHALAAAIIG